MSLRNFIRRTQMLIQHGLHVTRDRGFGELDRPLELTALEQRVLFSASAVAPIAAEIAEAGAALVDASGINATATAPSVNPDTGMFQLSDQQLLDVVADSFLPASQDVAAAAADVSADEHTLELVFLDSSIENIDQMMADLRAESANDTSRTLEFVVLDSSKDGIAQITSALLRYNGVDGIHVVSHGGTGQVQLGSTWLNIHSLDTYRNAISAWQYSMSDKADILFYGCNLAGSDEGQQLLNEISMLTDCDAAASEDATGSAKRNADWDLEYQIGTITTDVVFSSEFRADADFILATYTVTNTNDNGAGSFRQALIDARANAGADTINFSIGTGVQTITLTTGQLADIDHVVTINATTQSGYAGQPLIVLNGNNVYAEGLKLTAGSSGSTIRGLVISNFTQDGIEIQSSNNLIAGNYIGTNQAGTAAAGNNVGVNISTGSNNTIGGTTVADRNVISGNTNIGVNIWSGSSNVISGNYIGVNSSGSGDLGNQWYGVGMWSASGNTIGGSVSGAGNVISGTGTSGTASFGIYADAVSGNTVIRGNTIGLNAAGTAAIANQGTGITLLSSNNTVGGTGSFDSNIISGNQSHGIRITGSSASNNAVLGNYVGTDSTGLLDVGNALNGIMIDSSATNNTIGGLTAASRNIISGNDNAGIAVDNAGTTGNLIVGNYIGLGADGTTARGNTHNGVHFNTSGANTLGSTDSNGRNVISSNSIHGVGVADATNVTILGNYIGTDATGTLAHGNAGDGVRVFSGTASGIQIGGTAAGSGNLIANNTGDGILVSSSSATAASILRNSIYSNGEQGIDVGADDGLTYNDVSDSDTGSNNLINFPILKTAISAGGNTTITGKVTGLASTSFRVEFFSNSYGIQDASGYGEARTYIGFVDVTTNASGTGTFSATLTGVTLETGATVTATATQFSTGTPVATSEFAGNILANQTNLMITGTYIGNGVDDRVYTGLGFRPEAVIIARQDFSQSSILRTSTMSGDAAKSMEGAIAMEVNLIQSLNASGFTLGNDSRVNANGVIYHWIAFGSGDAIDIGSYSGTASSQSITGVGFQSELVFTASSGTGRAGFSSSLTTGSTFRFDNASPITTNALSAYGVDGFTVGTNAIVNQSGQTMHYVAFNQNANYFVQGSYTGNGVDNRNVTGVGFESEFLMIRQTTGTQWAAIKPESSGYNVDTTLYLTTTSPAPWPNTIQALQSDGFQLGTYSDVNTNGATYNYFAFRQNDSPLIVDTTSDSNSGSDTSSMNALRASRGADGRISLREAIAATNATRNVNGTVNEIDFAISGSGVQTITLASTLPTINDAVMIDAWTQSGWNNSPLIEVNGNNTAADGFNLGSGSTGSMVRGFIINRMAGDGIEISSSNNHIIEGNWIGLNNTGTAVSANTQRGINALNATGLTIGGTIAASRNVISGNGQQGIYFDNVDTSFVYGNYVGTNVAGTGDINGTTANTAQTGFVMLNGSSGNQIGNTSLAGARNVFSGNNHYGVEIQTNTSINNTVVGNFIGTDATGLAALGNTGGGFSFWGSGTGNLLGGNVVSGNLGIGVLVGNSASGSQIQGNYVGVGVDGSTLVSNGSTGIFVGSSAVNTLIGTNADSTNDAAEANTVSGNLDGIVVTDAGTTGTMIYGNYIGTTANGLIARGNTWDGIRIANGATGALIGGSGTARRNFISGNGQDGVHIDGPTTHGNTIQNNWIGLAADGVTVLGNGGNGIYISGGADNTVIGGIGLGNVIMGSRVVGIEIDGTSTGTSILGNLIGINAAGTVIHGSGENGILLENGAASTTIGGTTAGQGNTIVDSGRLSAAWQSGVSLTSTAGSSNSIIGNSIYDNRGLGIDLGTTGVTANDNLDADSGANTLQNSPVLTTATTNGSTVIISGTLNTLASTAGILIHFYATPSTGSVNTRQGRRYLGSTTVSTNASGNATFTNVSLSAAVTAGELITATTTRSSNTSEFSQAIVATGQTRLYLDGTGTGSDIPIALLKTATPTDVILPNYDHSRDSLPGIILLKGGSGVNESDPVLHQTWISSTTATTLSGPYSLSLYSAMKDFDTTKGGSITAYLIDTNSTGSSSTAIATATGTWPTRDRGSTTPSTLATSVIPSALADSLESRLSWAAVLRTICFLPTIRRRRTQICP